MSAEHLAADRAAAVSRLNAALKTLSNRKGRSAASLVEDNPSAGNGRIAWLDWEDRLLLVASEAAAMNFEIMPTLFEGCFHSTRTVKSLRAHYYLLRRSGRNFDPQLLPMAKAVVAAARLHEAVKPALLPKLEESRSPLPSYGRDRKSAGPRGHRDRDRERDGDRDQPAPPLGADVAVDDAEVPRGENGEASGKRRRSNRFQSGVGADGDVLEPATPVAVSHTIPPLLSDLPPLVLDGSSGDSDAAPVPPIVPSSTPIVPPPSSAPVRSHRSAAAAPTAKCATPPLGAVTRQLSPTLSAQPPKLTPPTVPPPPSFIDGTVDDTATERQSQMASRSARRALRAAPLQLHAPTSPGLPDSGSAGGRSTPRANVALPPALDSVLKSRRNSQALKRALSESAALASPLSPLDVFSRRQIQAHVIALRSEAFIRRYRPVIMRLMEHPMNGGVFNEPVDPEELGIPDYPEIVKCPMDLGTIRQRLEANEYVDASDLAADVRLVFSNAMLYNATGYVDECVGTG